MKFWRKSKFESGGGEVARAALGKASITQLIEEVVTTLARTRAADRFGVWLEPEKFLSSGKESHALRGMVWEDGVEHVPPEWGHLDPKSPLPFAVIAGGMSVEERLSHSSESVLVGPLIGLRKVLWVPVHDGGTLRGVLMAGNRSSDNEFPRSLMESLAAELALIRAFRSEELIALQRHNDLRLCRQVFAGLAQGELAESWLSAIVESCVGEGVRQEGLAAVFATLGTTSESTRREAGVDLEVSFRWSAGDIRWSGSASGEPIVSLWRNALDSGKTTGAEIASLWSRSDAARVVAVPLLSGESRVGVLIAGFRPNDASLSKLERLELRAGLACTVFEHKQRKQREQSGAEWQKALLEATMQPVVLLDSVGQLTSWNSAAQEFFEPYLPAYNESKGNPESALLGMPFTKLFRPREREVLEHWERQTRKQGSSISAESKEIEVSPGFCMRLHATKAPEGKLAIAVQVSGGKFDAAEIRANTELLNLVEWLEQGVVLFDEEDRIRVLSLRFAQLAGLTPQELDRYTTLETLISRLGAQTANPQLFAQRWMELARGEESGLREEIHFLRPTMRILERVSRPLLDSKGKKLGRLELYKDLTAQRLFHSKLLQTEKLAALGQMVSGIAHELSNPLTSILGYAQRLQMKSEGRAVPEEVKRIYAEAERASSILRQILVSSRDSAPERRPVDLNQIIQKTIELQRFSLAAEKIHVELCLSSELSAVNGDSNQLQQILLNLIGNARQAIESQGSGGTIQVRTEQAEDQRVRVEVSDSGVGIPEVILNRIFDPFFTTKPPGVGTGLGLSIVLSLVREHGGKIQARNEPGKGAVFTIDFPAAEKRHATSLTWGDTSRAQNDDRMQRSRTSRKPKRNAGKVLVVEDEPTVAKLLEDVLQDEGFRVEAVLDGRRALHRAQSEKFDLIICDMKMPELDGPNFFHAVRQDGQDLSQRFLFVTGDVLSAATRDFLEQNQLPFVAKPFRVDELSRKVHQVLQESLADGAVRVRAARKSH